MRRYHTWRRNFHPEIARELQCILEQNSNPRAVIVFAPSLDWKRQLFQRPQQLALALARQGALVFYAQLSPLEGKAHFENIQRGLYLCSLPLEQFSILDDYFVYLLTWNRKYLLKLDQPHILYDYLDEINAFEGDQEQLSRDHLALLSVGDVVTASAHQLCENVEKFRPDVLRVPNGVDFEHFQRDPSNLVFPQDIASIRKEGKPIVGFYGAFAGWFDYALMAELATNRMDRNFVLIGTKHDNSLDESGLLKMTNVHYLGPKSYSELSNYLAGFDVAILPFKVNQVTQSTSPIKLFEYFAGGKPVVSTPLREVMQYDAAFIARDSREFANMIDAALGKSKESQFICKLQDIARKNTWEQRAEQILSAMEKKLTGNAKKTEMP